jgi:epoxyqueuosine reductase
VRYLQELEMIAVERGCAGLGATHAGEFSGLAVTLRDRLDSGAAGKLRFTYKDPERAADVRNSYPWAQSLLVASWPYMPGSGGPGPSAAGSGRIARFATQNHYSGLRAALEAVAAQLEADGYRAAVLIDDERLVDRAAAVRAGVGWHGKSSMVLDPKYGPWLLLGSVVTDAALHSGIPMTRDCGKCDACIPACPTGAIVAPGILDASLCIAHWTQVAGIIPRRFRMAMGDRLYGCDECLDACPPGHRVMASDPHVMGRVDLVELLATDDETLLRRYEHLYIPRNNPRFVRRNALVALGNSAAAAEAAGRVASVDLERIVGVLAGFLGDPDELYRIHAGWALGRIGGRVAAALLRARLVDEAAPEVVHELEHALGACAGGRD